MPAQGYNFSLFLSLSFFLPVCSCGQCEKSFYYYTTNAVERTRTTTYCGGRSVANIGSSHCPRSSSSSVDAADALRATTTTTAEAETASTAGAAAATTYWTEERRQQRCSSSRDAKLPSISLRRRKEGKESMLLSPTTTTRPCLLAIGRKTRHSLERREHPKQDLEEVRPGGNFSGIEWILCTYQRLPKSFRIRLHTLLSQRIYTCVFVNPAFPSRERVEVSGGVLSLA